MIMYFNVPDMYVTINLMARIIHVDTLMYKQDFNNVTHEGAVMPSLCIGIKLLSFPNR